MRQAEHRTQDNPLSNGCAQGMCVFDLLAQWLLMWHIGGTFLGTDLVTLNSIEALASAHSCQSPSLLCSTQSHTLGDILPEHRATTSTTATIPVHPDAITSTTATIPVHPDAILGFPPKHNLFARAIRILAEQPNASTSTAVGVLSLAVAEQQRMHDAVSHRNSVPADVRSALHRVRVAADCESAVGGRDRGASKIGLLLRWHAGNQRQQITGTGPQVKIVFLPLASVTVL